jgi:hypothetical protein
MDEPRPRSRRRTGRPEGISLSPEDRAMLVSAVEAGATDHAAAQAAGISERTFRDWRARAEGRHPTRKATPELLELFEQIAEAKGRARVLREIEVARDDPKHWLRYQARSKPGLDGWTEPVPEATEEQGAKFHDPTLEELEEILRVLAEATGILPGSCDLEDCPCPRHLEDRDDAA